MSSSATTPSSTSVRLVALGVVATLLLFISGALFAGTANAAADKVWVCKYVGTPGEDERLSSGRNPISVSVNATGGAGVGGFFNDAQGRSYVLAVVLDDDDDDDDDDRDDTPKCPNTPPGPTTPPVTETTPPVTETTPVITETTPVVTETTPVVTETTPVVTETTPVVTETTPVVTETTPVVTETTPVVTETTPVVTETDPGATTTPTAPGVAPTDLGPSQSVGIFSLFALAGALVGAAGLVVRSGKH